RHPGGRPRPAWRRRPCGRAGLGRTGRRDDLRAGGLAGHRGRRREYAAGAPLMQEAARLSVWNALLASVAEEMGVTLGLTAHSPNIRERRDYSCAVFDPDGEMVAQAAHI